MRTEKDILLATFYDRDRLVFDHQPMDALEHQQTTQGDDERGHAFVHDDGAHRGVNPDAEQRGQDERNRRGNFVVNDEHRGHTTRQAQAAAHAQVDVTRQDDEQHAETQDRRGGELDR